MKTLKLLLPEWQGYGEHNRVADGARLVYQSFSSSSEFEEVEIPEKETLERKDGILGRSSLARNAQMVQDKVNSLQPDRILMIGGTCGCELVPVAYLNYRYGPDLAVLWFDAHGDLNTPESSPSGHFHGMVLRTLLGEGHPDLIEFVPTALNPNQVSLVGVRDLDPSEDEYCSANGIPIIHPTSLDSSAPIVSAISRSGASNLYVHLDLDFFDPNDFPSVLVPTPGGISMDDLSPILRDLNAQFNVVGLSVVEFMPDNAEMVDKIPALFDNSGITNRFN